MMRKPPPVALELDACGGKLQMVCVLNGVLLYNIILLFLGPVIILMDYDGQLYEIFSPSVHFGGVTLAVNIKNASEQYKVKEARCKIHNSHFLSKNDNSKGKKVLQKKILNRMSLNLNLQVLVD